MLLALTLALTAFAQDSVAPSTSVFDDSLEPVLADMLEVATAMEERGIQITDVVIGIVPDDGMGVSVPVTLPADTDVILAAIRDDRRIADLDMGVSGTDGLSGSDQLDDNVPRVDIHTTYAGEYTAKVVISAAQPGSDKGYFLFVTGFPREYVAASALPLLETMQLVVGFAESQDMHFVHGDMETVGAGKATMLEAPIPQNTFLQCIAFAASSPDRTKKAYLEVTDAGGNRLGKGKKVMIPQLVGAAFINAEDNPRHLLRVSTKMRPDYGDTHVLGMVACQ